MIKQISLITLLILSYSKLLCQVNYLHPILLNDKVGYINDSGTVIIKPFFDKEDFFATNPSTENVILGKVAGKVTLIDRAGNVIITGDYDNARIFPEVKIVALGVKKNNLDRESYYTFFDYNGKQLTKTNFLFAYFSVDVPFENNTLVYNSQNKNGLINSKGEIIISPKFYSLDHLYRNGYIIYQIEKGGKYGVMDSIGRIITPAIFNKIIQISKSNFAIIENSSLDSYDIFDLKRKTFLKYRITNLSKEKGLRFNFKSATHFISSDSLGLGLKSINNNFINEIRLRNIEFINDSTIAAGYMNDTINNFKYVFNLELQQIGGPFDENAQLANFRQDGLFIISKDFRSLGYSNSNGSLIIDYQTIKNTLLFSFFGEIARVINEKGEWGYINNKGKFIWDFKK